MNYEIDTDFPGGNAIIESIQGDHITFRPDLRDTEGHWFYWALRVTNAAGRQLHFKINSEHCLTHAGPAYSRDAGRTWRWLTAGQFDVEACQFSIAVPQEAEELRLSMAMPYTMEHWLAALPRWADSPNVKQQVLCQSRTGRDVPMLTIGPAQPKYRIVASARRHACEMMTNYVIEGMIDHWLAGEWGELREVKEQTELRIIPFVDFDGVEQGDQGKNRRPHDHNRDYIEQAIYPETIALMQQIPALGNTDIWLDLHCPWIKNGCNEWIYQVGKAEPANWQAQQSFAQVLEKQVTGELPYFANDDLPFGQEWNTGEGAKLGYRTSSSWGATLPGCRLSTSMEFPYANVHDKLTSAQGYHEFGQSLVVAMMRWLVNEPPRLK